MSTSVPPPGYIPPPSHASVDGEPAAISGPHAARGRPRLLIGLAGFAVAAVLAFVLLGASGAGVTDPIAQAATLSSGTAGYRMTLGFRVASPALPAAISGSG